MVCVLHFGVFYVNIQASTLMFLVYRWAILRIELLNTLVQLSATLLIISSKGSLSASMAGVIINLILGYSSSI